MFKIERRFEISHINCPLVVIFVQVDSRWKRYSAAVVEESAKRELEETVEWTIFVGQLVRFVGFGRHRITQLIRIDGIEVGGIGGVLDFRYVRRR